MLVKQFKMNKEVDFLGVINYMRIKVIRISIKVKGVIRASEGTVRAGKGTIRTGQEL